MSNDVYTSYLYQHLLLNLEESDAFREIEIKEEPVAEVQPLPVPEPPLLEKI